VPLTTLRSIAEITARSPIGRGSPSAVAAGRPAPAPASTPWPPGREIGQVAQMIADIAGRTNLLGAERDDRGGARREAGQGLAVVAGEVKAARHPDGALHPGDQPADQRRGGSHHSATEAVAQMAPPSARIEGISTSVPRRWRSKARRTAEIARSVAETAEAARVGGPSAPTTVRAAKQTDSQSNDVLQSAGELKRRCRAAPYRRPLVPPSTDEVDRRAARASASPERTAALPGGKRFPVHIADISAGGAMLQTVAEQAGTEARLTIEGETFGISLSRPHEMRRRNFCQLIAATRARVQRLWPVSRHTRRAA